MRCGSRALAPLSLFFLLSAGAAAAQQPTDAWSFVVGGDSRNCGDIVMPAVAAGARAAGAAFYWHLGDFRAIYDFDQDFVAQRRAQEGPPPTIAAYQNSAWEDFIESQLSPFGSLPIYLAMGNHEAVAPKSRAEYLAQFADWLNSPAIARLRLSDDPKDHRLKTYYHWIEKGIDFLTLDNATPDQFDTAQVKWLEGVLARDAADAGIRSIVVGMHAALPDSIAASHSMNDWAQGAESGRRVYADLLRARESGKNVYVLASHSHFYLANIFATPYWESHGGVLPGWIIGTAGAVRYALPGGVVAGQEAKTNVYGYLAATVDAEGKIRFEFREISRADIAPAIVKRFTPELVDQCFQANREGR
jgi:hypothetical protein